VQERGIARRLARGEKIIGHKMGLTSSAKRVQMSLDLPIYGVLTDAMRASSELRVLDRVHPKIEPEIAFVTARELRGRISSPHRRKRGQSVPIATCRASFGTSGARARQPQASVGTFGATASVA